VHQSASQSVLKLQLQAADAPGMEDYELTLYASPRAKHSIAVLRASHYNEFAKALHLLVGSDEIADQLREAGDDLRAGETTVIAYGTWHIEMTAPVAAGIAA
jgi:hypothetical protein